MEQNPFVTDIEEATKQNENYRTALWTGKNLQVTLMSIAVGEDIGLEVHNHIDNSCALKKAKAFAKWVTAKTI